MAHLQQPGTVQIITVNQPEARGPKSYESYKSKTSMVLGWIQITIAVLCIIFNVVGMAIQNDRPDGHEHYLFHVGSGIWCGFFFILSGGLAVGAAKKKTAGVIISMMIFSIFSAIFGFNLMGWASGEVAVDNDTKDYGRSYDYYYSYYNNYYNEWGSLDKTSYAMGVLMLIMSFVVIVVTIWTSALGCAALCCGPSPGRYPGYAATVVPAVRYNNTGQQMTTVYYGMPTTVMTTNQNVQMISPYVGHMQAPPTYAPNNAPPTYTMQPEGQAQVHMPSIPSATQGAGASNGQAPAVPPKY